MTARPAPTSVRFPPELLDDLRTCAERRGLTPGAFIVKAVARVVEAEKAKLNEVSPRPKKAKS